MKFPLLRQMIAIRAVLKGKRYNEHTLFFFLSANGHDQELSLRPHGGIVHVNKIVPQLYKKKLKVSKLNIGFAIKCFNFNFLKFTSNLMEPINGRAIKMCWYFVLITWYMLSDSQILWRSESFAYVCFRQCFYFLPICFHYFEMCYFENNPVLSIAEILTAVDSIYCFYTFEQFKQDTDVSKPLIKLNPLIRLHFMSHTSFIWKKIVWYVIKLPTTGLKYLIPFTEFYGVSPKILPRQPFRFSINWSNDIFCTSSGITF